MLSERIVTILPDISFEEAVEITRIHSVTGKNTDSEGLISTRPFRRPHHTSTKTSIIGGGRNPKPGEISLAHYGVLYLDELSEFNKETIEMLRGPLEEKKITISRANATVTYPSNFILLASMNPCPCGYYGSNLKQCKCSGYSIRRYLSKFSGPFLDRIDMQIEVKPTEYIEISNSKKTESSSDIKRRVNKARNIQKERYNKEKIKFNSELNQNQIEKFCELEPTSKKILQQAFEKLKLSGRAYNKIIKLARTIADLDNEDNIKAIHIAEAIQYRSLDRTYWGGKR